MSEVGRFDKPEPLTFSVSETLLNQKYKADGVEASGRVSMEPLAVSVPQAAKLLGVTPPTIYANLIHRAGFPVFSIGKRKLVSVEGLRRWVAERAGGAAG